MIDTIENIIDDLKNAFENMIENDQEYKLEFYDDITKKLHRLRTIVDKLVMKNENM